ncbi:MAG: IS256 family transposase [Chloracidobacterium sp.]|nr:IS256 family transposase [Chloracidobacterium sp.]MCO5334884.1 IS256 family transposase [Pyrinomonadaceae bacterium]MBE7516109.1 IS256 family transposase [Chloracidobacterium sp.]MBE7516124.1 IS256 family transposase [Chloracidobacterium sp.]MBE7517105.1 IS256 family transposase [Chloracidobacterium sp.]
MTIDNELIDNLLKDYKKPEDLIGEDGLLKQLTKRLLERAMAAELTEHVGYEKHEASGRGSGNSRNGTSRKTLKGNFGTVPIEVPRDRAGTFEPQIVGKHQTRFTGFDEKIISLYARGMSTREIQQHIEEIYQVEVSPTLVSTVTDAVIDEVKAWQNRQLDEVYPILYLDALQFKVRDQGHVRNKAVYLAIGVNMDGLKEVLGMWIAQSEGAKFWLSVVTELKNRGVNDIIIACVDGLKGFPEAIETVFPKAEVQLCIVHMVRHSLNYVGWKERKEVARDLKTIYSSATDAEAEQRLDEFADKWDARFPTISRSWRSNWTRIIPFFAYPPEIRRVIYTTNAIESLNMTLRKVTKARGSFPNDEAVQKLLYLALRNITKKWTMPIRDWKAALSRFAIVYEDRLPQS